jgi:hypothetical protein
MLVNECRRRKLNEGPSEKCRKLQRGSADRMFSERGNFRIPVLLAGDEDDCQWGMGTHLSHFPPLFAI